MLAKRVIPCLDVKDGRVVKGINFVNLRDAGDPVECGLRYSEEGADELVFLDITASSDRRNIVAGMVRRVADSINIPFTVGGGLQNIDDIRTALLLGADKVSLNTSAIQNPDLISRGFIYMKENKALIEETRHKVKKIVNDHNANGAADENYIRNRIRDDIGKFLSRLF